jgi:hypothetical protein
MRIRGGFQMTLRILFMLAALFIPAASVHAEERIKLTGPELAARNSGYEVLAGVSKEPGLGFNFMVVAYQNGTREIYWNDGVKSGTDTGHLRIAGDQTCVTWKTSFESKEHCYDVYKTGEDKYESWRNGKIAFSYYKIR